MLLISILVLRLKGSRVEFHDNFVLHGHWLAVSEVLYHCVQNESFTGMESSISVFVYDFFCLLHRLNFMSKFIDKDTLSRFFWVLLKMCGKLLVQADIEKYNARSLFF